MEQRANFVTLAVEDVDRSRAFYVDGLGWQPVFEAPGEVLFLPVGHGLVLSLWSRAGFTAEVGEPSTGLAPITLAHNVLSPAEVDEVLAGAAAAGAPVTPGEQREWGGYSGYFADPDGYRWEVAHDPSPLGDGLVTQSRRWLAARTPSPVAGVAPAVQDHYPEDAAHCYGCGARNPQGHQLKTRWAGESRTETVTRFVPGAEQTAMPGYVYGGLVASVVDCSGTGSAALAATHAAGRDLEAEGALRFVTGTLEVRYVRPTPMGEELVVTGRIEELKGRKVTVSLTVEAAGSVVAEGRVVALQLPDEMRA
jgi:catechol 2,3-dioxygenase-like lactoylglutathione lyase family enzyme/acyl-CoA hydrolase